MMTDKTNEKISPKLIAAILATGILNFAGITVETAMNITFPILIEQFNIGISTVQWMTTLYLLVVAATVPISSFLKRRFTLKKLFIVANICFIAGVVMDIIAPSFSILLLGRFAQGVGTGIALPLMFNIILEQVPRQKLGTMIGLGTLITAVAPTVGPTFGGVMASSLGWRYIFICLLPILIFSFILGIMTIEQKTEPQKIKLDVVSFIAIVATLVGFIYSLSNLSAMSFISLHVLGAFVMGIVGLGIFIYRSNHQESPLINLVVFKNVSFDGHAVSSFILLASLLGLNLVLPNYIQLV
ncbi:MAG: MFS transporter, partial [Lactococcus raffinolactis]